MLGRHLIATMYFQCVNLIRAFSEKLHLSLLKTLFADASRKASALPRNPPGAVLSPDIIEDIITEARRLNTREEAHR